MNRSVATYLAGAAVAATAALAAAYAPLCAAQQDTRPLYQVEVIAFAYTNANPGEEVFPRQTPPEAASDLAADVPLEEFDFESALDIEAPAVVDQSDAAEVATAPGEAAPSGGADAAPGAAPPGAETQGLAATSTEPLIGERGFRLLGPESYKLSAAYAKLERLQAYRPLMHAAWIEPALPEDQARTISTADLGALNPEGGLELYASRYLHFTVNLRYRPTAEQRAALSAVTPPAADPDASQTGTSVPSRPLGSSSGSLGDSTGNSRGAPVSGSPGVSAGSPITGSPIAGSAGPVAGLGSSAGPYGTAIDEISLGPSLTMKASRRVAAGELQYFDHPYFGLLVLVTPYEPQPPKNGQDGVAPVP